MAQMLSFLYDIFLFFVPYFLSFLRHDYVPFCVYQARLTRPPWTSPTRVGLEDGLGQMLRSRSTAQLLILQSYKIC